MRVLYVDTAAFATLAAIDREGVLGALEWSVVVPRAIADELTDDPAATKLERAREEGVVSVVDNPIRETHPVSYNLASSYLDLERDRRDHARTRDGDVALLAYGLHNDTLSSIDRTALVTDDVVLRSKCAALGIEVAGTMSVLVAAVERGALEADDAKSAFLAMDEVGPRISVTSLRTAVKLINEAVAGEREREREHEQEREHEREREQERATRADGALSSR